MSKNNVHPDHYKVGGRDRQDDAAAARFARSVAAKATSRGPDRMAKEPYFRRPEPAPPGPAGQRGKPAPKKSSPRAGAAKKSAARKASSPRKTAARKAPRKTGGTGKRASRKK